MFLLDLHTHTISSGHAYSTLEENVQGAIRSQLKLLGMSDHASTMPGGPHPFHFLNLKIVPDTIQGIRVLKGIEANIVDFNGSIDVDDNILNALDYAIASLHPPVLIPGEMSQNTNALLKAMEHPQVKVIGHPDDGRYALDYEAVVLKAKATGTLLELNNASLSPVGSRENTEENAAIMLQYCMKHQVPIILGSDAHISYDVGNFSRCIQLMASVDFPEHLVINKDIEAFFQYTGIKK